MAGRNEKTKSRGFHGNSRENFREHIEAALIQISRKPHGSHGMADHYGHDGVARAGDYIEACTGLPGTSDRSAASVQFVQVELLAS